MGNNKSNTSTQSSEPRKVRVSKKSSKSSEPKRQFGVHMAETAWRVAVPFLLFVLGGTAIDKTLGTMPVFTLIGLVVAVLAMSLAVYKYVNHHFPETFERNDK